MIEMVNVSKLFALGEGTFVPGLVDVSLSVNSGETISIVGSNGSGKTSLLNCIAGMLQPDSGEVCLLGRQITQMNSAEVGRIVAFVRQNPGEGTAAYLTVEENLTLGALRGRPLGLRRLLRNRAKEKTLKLLEQVGGGLTERLLQPAKTLSGGQRQALAMMTAVVGRPKLLLLDEHTASLDPNARKTISDLTVTLAKDFGLTVLAVTHNLADAICFGDRLLVMHTGRIVMDVSGQQKKKLTADGLIQIFREHPDNTLASDSDLSLNRGE